MSDQQSITIVQSLIRGRATQNEMYQGMEQNIQLIKELQIHQEVSAVQQENKRELQKQYRQKMLEKSQKDQMLAQIYQKVTSQFQIESNMSS